MNPAEVLHADLRELTDDQIASAIAAAAVQFALCDGDDLSCKNEALEALRRLHHQGGVRLLLDLKRTPRQNGWTPNARRRAVISRPGPAYTARYSREIA